jgi:hypothetical protein
MKREREHQSLPRPANHEVILRRRAGGDRCVGDDGVLCGEAFGGGHWGAFGRVGVSMCGGVGVRAFFLSGEAVCRKRGAATEMSVGKCDNEAYMPCGGD